MTDASDDGGHGCARRFGRGRATGRDGRNTAEDAVHARARRPRALLGASRRLAGDGSTNARRVCSRRATASSADGRRAGPALGPRRRSLGGATVGDRRGRLRERAPRPERGRDLVRDRARIRDGATTARSGTSRSHGAAGHRATARRGPGCSRAPCSRPPAIARRCGAADVLIRAALATDRGLTRVGTVDADQLAVIEAAIEVADPGDTTTYARLWRSTPAS